MGNAVSTLHVAWFATSAGQLATAYMQFLPEFSDLLSSLLVSTDKFIIVGDFNIHMDDDTDSLKMVFNSLLNSLGFSQ